MLAHLSALWSFSIEAVTGISFSPSFLCSLLVNPSHQCIHHKYVLLAAQLVFSQVCYAGVEG